MLCTEHGERELPMSGIELLNDVRFHGMKDNANASGIVFWKDVALVVTDESKKTGNVVQWFRPDGTDYRAVEEAFIRLDPPGVTAAEEMDLEGLAVAGNSVYVLGSHSARRRKVDPSGSYATNRSRLMSPPEAQPSRDVLIHVTLSDDGEVRTMERSSLRQVIEQTEPLASFAQLPSKENGVDAEGLAIWHKHLYVGFRGPVLRSSFTPILRCRFGSPVTEPELLFVNLGGRGVRDLAHVEKGLLILAGPMADEPTSYRLYLWDGRDGVAGDGAPTTEADPGLYLLGELPLPGAGEGLLKPEGLALKKESDTHWIVMVVFDGLNKSHAIEYRVGKPD